MFLTPLFIILIICLLTQWAGGLQPVNVNGRGEGVEFRLRTGIENGTIKSHCTTTKTFCFQDTDCAKLCLEEDTFTCAKGVCELDMKRVREDSLASENCDTSMGMATFLVGDTAFGRYQRLCKSIDPGIAISSKTNLMCKGGDTIINYINKFPSIDNCTNCDKKITIPATVNKRRHVECNSPFYDMVLK